MVRDSIMLKLILRKNGNIALQREPTNNTEWREPLKPALRTVLDAIELAVTDLGHNVRIYNRGGGST